LQPTTAYVVAYSVGLVQPNYRVCASGTFGTALTWRVDARRDEGGERLPAHVEPGRVLGVSERVHPDVHRKWDFVYIDIQLCMYRYVHIDGYIYVSGYIYLSLNLSLCIYRYTVMYVQICTYR